MGRQEQRPEMPEAGPEIKEFVRRDVSREAEPDKSSPLWLAFLPAVMLAVALCGILWLKVPLIAVLLVVFLEGVLALCLRNTPIWLHVLVAAANIALGIAFGMKVFMVLACLVYLTGIVLAHYYAR